VLRRFKIPDLRRFVTSRLRRFKIPDFVDSRLRGFVGSIFQIFIDSTSLRTYFMNFVKPDVLRVTIFFLNSPTLAPRGSGLTLMIRFHEKL
jgi:hypothetical protein